MWDYSCGNPPKPAAAAAAAHQPSHQHLTSLCVAAIKEHFSTLAVIVALFKAADRKSIMDT